MATQQLNLQAMIYLTSPRNWNTWLSVTKSTSLALEIWDYVNPDTEEHILSTESSKSAVSQIKADTTTIIDLKEDELTQYNYLHKNWKEKKTVFEKIKQSLTLFHSHLHSIVDANMIVYLIKNKDSLYKIMTALKEKYSMSTETCQKNVLDHYMILKQFLKDEDLVLWCDK